jgi:transcription initiation factor TFIIIB Brf1 subunit/transcription initiation factor TFIIB
MIECIAAGAKTKTKDLWLDGDSASFMEVEFKRPMVVPLSLRVETAEEASKCRSKETDETLEAAYNQIETCVIEARLDGNVRQAAKTYYKRVHDVEAFEDRSQDTSCIFIACRDCKNPTHPHRNICLHSRPERESECDLQVYRKTPH